MIDAAPSRGHKSMPGEHGSLSFIYLIRRNYLVWRRQVAAALVAHVADPLVWLIGLGYGLGRLLPPVEGMSYLQFLGTGMLCSTVMQRTSYEALWSAFTRLRVQRTWDNILHTPMTVSDIVLGEWFWAAIKGSVSGFVILLVLAAFGLVSVSAAMLLAPLVLLVGLAFSAISLIVTALSDSYDVFTYYFSLAVWPMTFFSGVFFPIEELPEALRVVGQALPLAHATALSRSLALASFSPEDAWHIVALMLYAAGCLAIAMTLMQRRLAN